MTEPRFIIKEGEHGPEYWEGDDKLAFINETGNLQSTRGNADRKPDIAAFIDWHAAHDNPSATENDAQGDPDAGVIADDALRGESEASDSVPHETNRSAETISIAPVEEPIPAVKKFTPPTGSPELGEKDPVVIAWHFKHDRAAAEKKYARLKHLWPI